MTYRPRSVALASLLLAAAAPAQPPPPPIAVLPPPSPNVKPSLLTFGTGVARCGDEIVAPVRMEPIAPVWMGWSPGARTPAALTFRIDADGRPLGIGGYAGPAQSDLIPALAASRFPAGRIRPECRITFEIQTTPLADAPPAAAAHYLVAPHTRRPEEAVLFRRLHPEGSTCATTTPKVRLRAYPDFEAIAQPPGTWSWAMTRFDIDRSGKPVKVTIADSSGNAALDKAAVRAVQDSRFAPEAKTGCTYPYSRRSIESLPAPAIPDRASFVPADARCPDQSEQLPGTPLRFPDGFERRRIEGWAVIGFDVAPWGERGNVRVLAAEPAAAFGTQAQQIVRSVREPASSTGRAGCIQVVRFAMPPGGETGAQSDRED